MDDQKVHPSTFFPPFVVQEDIIIIIVLLLLLSLLLMTFLIVVTMIKTTVKLDAVLAPVPDTRAVQESCHPLFLSLVAHLAVLAVPAQHVPRQVVHAREGRAAAGVLADVGPLARVAQFVDLQVILGDEGRRAVSAAVRSLAGVDPIVAQQMARAGKGGAAIPEFADVGAVSLVNEEVVPEVLGAVEVCIAPLVWAPKRARARVDHAVPPELVSRLERTTANCAYNNITIINLYILLVFFIFSIFLFVVIINCCCCM
jgi:hypothetical protein